MPTTAKMDTSSGGVGRRGEREGFKCLQAQEDKSKPLYKSQRYSVPTFS